MQRCGRMDSSTAPYSLPRYPFQPPLNRHIGRRKCGTAQNTLQHIRLPSSPPPFQSRNLHSSTTEQLGDQRSHVPVDRCVYQVMLRKDVLQAQLRCCSGKRDFYFCSKTLPLQSCTATHLSTQLLYNVQTQPMKGSRSDIAIACMPTFVRHAAHIILFFKNPLFLHLSYIFLVEMRL